MRSSASVRPGQIRRIVALAGAVVLIVVWIALRQRQPNLPPSELSVGDSAPLTPLTGSPFRNTQPGVAYVGDDGCLGCHRKLTQAYHQHPMGRSLFHAAGTTNEEPYDGTGNNPFRAGQFKFQAVRHGEQVIHREWCEDSGGRVVAEQEVAVAYAIGSGTQARSYLVRKGDFLFESPITWYPGVKQWRPSPGYAETPWHFDRGIDSRCLYCHCQEAHSVPHTTNKYGDPPFGQLAIGCERCHGPGELHVNARKAAPASDGVDDTIVNPRHLTPHLREAVCQQCHLQGESIIPRRGRAQTDYRPGLPLEEYVSIFVRPTDLNDPKRIVGHVEQMNQSACFQKSGGAFGCTSCHDPHRAPAPAQRAEFYRERCQSCHTPDAEAKSGPRRAIPDCPVPKAERLAKAPGDNCLICHMPRSDSATLHLVVTDHRVLRRPDQRPSGRADPPGAIPLVAFHRPHPAADDEDHHRDLALAAIEVAEKAAAGGGDAVAAYLGQQALPLLDRAAARAPNDIPVLEARGSALLIRGRPEDALVVLQSALSQEPERERALRLAVSAAHASKRLELAEEYAQRLATAYPHDPNNLELLASILMQREKWPPALAATQTAIELSPFRPEPRALLVQIYLELGERGKARAEMDDLAAIDPKFHARFRPRVADRLDGPK